MKFSSSLLPKVNVPRKLHITILSVLGGLILILSLLYFLSVPSRFQLGAGYVFSPLTTDPDQTIITDGADAIAVGPARIRLWGVYPMVFGFTDRPEQERFLIDLENHEVRFFPAEADGFHQYDEFDAFFGSHPVTRDQAVTYRDLFPAPATAQARALRFALKKQLEKPTKKFSFRKLLP